MFKKKKKHIYMTNILMPTRKGQAYDLWIRSHTRKQKLDTLATCYFYLVNAPHPPPPIMIRVPRKHVCHFRRISSYNETWHHPPPPFRWQVNTSKLVDPIKMLVGGCVCVWGGQARFCVLRMTNARAYVIIRTQS